MPEPAGIAERTKPRNISVTATFDKDRHDMLEELARSLGVTKSLALNHLIDLHAGRALEEMVAKPNEMYEISRWRTKRLTGELVSDIAGMVREGNTKADAYRRVQVPPATGDRWEKKGRDDQKADKSSLYADLVASIDRARAEFNDELLQEARRKGDYKTLLKLLDPEQFNPVSRSAVDITHKLQLQIDWDAYSIEETKTLAYLLRKGSPPSEEVDRRKALPAAEAVPQDVAELIDVEDGEWTPADG